MAEMLFLIIWTSFFAILSLVLFFTKVYFGLLFSLFFFGVGIAMLYSLISKYLKKRNMEKKGEVCYGYLDDKVTFYLGSQNSLLTLNYEIGTHLDVFKKNAFVEVVYYNGVVLITKGDIPFESLPSNIQYHLNKYLNDKELEKQKELSESIEINGVRYRKID